jgi:hypothetical protein
MVKWVAWTRASAEGEEGGRSSCNSDTKLPGLRPSVAASQYQEMLTRRHGATERRKTRRCRSENLREASSRLRVSASPCGSFFRGPAPDDEKQKTRGQKIAENSAFRQSRTEGRCIARLRNFGSSPRMPRRGPTSRDRRFGKLGGDHRCRCRCRCRSRIVDYDNDHDNDNDRDQGKLDSSIAAVKLDASDRAADPNR